MRYANAWAGDADEHARWADRDEYAHRHTLPGADLNTLPHRYSALLPAGRLRDIHADADLSASQRMRNARTRVDAGEHTGRAHRNEHAQRHTLPDVRTR
jgi:hypothetical protein